MTTKKQKNELAFNDMCADGLTPEQYVLEVMRGRRKLNKANRHRYDAAVALLPYRLPRLNSIDATTRNVALSHDEWIKQMENGGDGEE